MQQFFGVGGRAVQVLVSRFGKPLADEFKAIDINLTTNFRPPRRQLFPPATIGGVTNTAGSLTEDPVRPRTAVAADHQPRASKPDPYPSLPLYFSGIGGGV